MTEIISVRFKNGGKDYYFNPNGVQYTPGQEVIIETARGVEFGECVEGNRMIDEMSLVSPLRPVLRAATDADRRTLEANKKREENAFTLCEQKIADRKLDMKLVSVEYAFDGSKILFFFTSDGRVDFRELVKDLASTFHTRIELRQIGVRDEAKMLGGLGVCGRPYCCKAYMADFQTVSIKMAKTQNLSLNPTKISGACGRLMCCLKYEQEAYEDALKRCPKNESLVQTPDGVGTVSAVNLLRENVRVRLDNDPDNPQTYACEDITVIRSGKGKRPEGYELPEVPEKPEPRLRRDAPSAPSRPRNSERKGDPLADLKPLESETEEVREPVESEETEEAAAPAVIEEPAAPEAEAAVPEEKQKPRHNDRNRGRNRRVRSEGKPAPEQKDGAKSEAKEPTAPAAQQPKKPHPKKPREQREPKDSQQAKPALQPQQEGDVPVKDKPHRPHNRYHHHRPKGDGTPKAE